MVHMIWTSSTGFAHAEHRSTICTCYASISFRHSPFLTLIGGQTLFGSMVPFYDIHKLLPPNEREMAPIPAALGPRHLTRRDSVAVQNSSPLTVLQILVSGTHNLSILNEWTACRCSPLKRAIEQDLMVSFKRVSLTGLLRYVHHPVQYLFWKLPSHIPLIKSSMKQGKIYQMHLPCSIVSKLKWTLTGMPNFVKAALSYSSSWKTILKMKLIAHSQRWMITISIISPSWTVSLATILEHSHTIITCNNNYIDNKLLYIDSSCGKSRRGE